MRKRLLAVLLAAACVAGAIAVCGPAGAGEKPKPKKPKPPIKVLMLGDSVGQGLALKGLPTSKRLEVVNAATVNCTISGGSPQGYKDGIVIGNGCPNWRTEWPALIEQHAPQVVLVFTSGWETVDRWFTEPPGEGLPSTILEPVFQQHVADAHREAATLLSATGAKVVFQTMPYINPPHAYPEPPGVNGISEIWWEAYGPDAPPPGWVPPLPGQPFVGSKHKADALNKVRLDLAKEGAINIVDLQKFVSPKGVYTDQIKGKPARDVDLSHFNDYGYRQITKWMVPQLEKLVKQKQQS